jgi:hypothetical protein
MLIDEENIVEQSLFTWLREQYFGDDATRDAAKRALGEVSILLELNFENFTAFFAFPPLFLHSFYITFHFVFFTECSCSYSTF